MKLEFYHQRGEIMQLTCNINAKKLKKNIGEKIKLYRKKRGLSQDRLAELVNMEMKSLSRIESGHNYPQCENLVAIANALDVAPWQLYFSEEENDIHKMRQELKEALNSDNSNMIFSLYQYYKIKSI